VGFFEFLVTVFLFKTIGEVLKEHIKKKPAPGSVSSDQVELLREEIRDLGMRLHHIEEERDFYKDLLAAPRGSSTPRSAD
jgi:hypothetical protein